MFNQFFQTGNRLIYQLFVLLLIFVDLRFSFLKLFIAGGDLLLCLDFLRIKFFLPLLVRLLARLQLVFSILILFKPVVQFLLLGIQGRLSVPDLSSAVFNLRLGVLKLRFPVLNLAPGIRKLFLGGFAPVLQFLARLVKLFLGLRDQLIPADPSPFSSDILHPVQHRLDLLIISVRVGGQFLRSFHLEISLCIHLRHKGALWHHKKTIQRTGADGGTSPFKGNIAGRASLSHYRKCIGPQGILHRIIGPGFQDDLVSDLVTHGIVHHALIRRLWKPPLADSHLVHLFRQGHYMEHRLLIIQSA